MTGITFRLLIDVAVIENRLALRQVPPFFKRGQGGFKTQIKRIILLNFA